MSAPAKTSRPNGETGTAIPPTDVTTDATLSPGFESGLAAVTDAVFVSVPLAAETVTSIVIERVDSGIIVPSEAMTVPPLPTAGPAQLPEPAVHDRNVVPGGSGSVTTTPVADAGPWFTTIRT